MKSNKSKLAIRNRIDSIRRDEDLMAFEKWRLIGQIVIDNLAKSGRFFNTDQGLFFFDDDSCRAAAIQKDDMTLATLLNHVYGINQKEIGFQRVLADLASEAHSNGRKIPIRRFAHYDETTRCSTCRGLMATCTDSTGDRLRKSKTGPMKFFSLMTRGNVNPSSTPQMFHRESSTDNSSSRSILRTRP